MKEIKAQISFLFKKIYSVWFPWLDIAILTFIYFFLWGEHINPYRHYQLIKYGEVAVGKISGEDGLYKYSDSPRMRDFEYTFMLRNGKIVKSSAHTFTIDKDSRTRPKYPVIAEISYLPNNPEINWIKSDLSSSVEDFLYRHLVFGTLFIVLVYCISMIVFRLSILDYRREKLFGRLTKERRILVELPRELMN